jgi:hypothetical protein
LAREDSTTATSGTDVTSHACRPRPA